MTWEVVSIRWDRPSTVGSGFGAISITGTPYVSAGPFEGLDAQILAEASAKRATAAGITSYARRVPVLPPEPSVLDDRTWELGT